MSMRSRIFVGLILIYIAGIAFLLSSISSQYDPRYRESAEESLVETSHLLAALLEQDVDNGSIDTWRLQALFRALYARPFEAQIYSLYKTRVELRAYVTDHRGYVMYDSTGRFSDADFSQWRDVSETLRGRYGARTTRDVPQDASTSVLYVAAPVMWQGRIVGVVSVGKPVRSFEPFVGEARSKTMRLGVMAAIALLVLAAIVGVWLIRPFGFVRAYASWLARERTLRPKRLLQGAVQQWRGVWAQTRDTLAGRDYVADYVQTLAHEIKSPLSAIRGASELLHDADASAMSAGQRQHFLASIDTEAQRIHETIERMLELSALEAQRVNARAEPIDLRALLREVAASASAAARRGVQVHIMPGDDEVPVCVRGDPFLLRRAIGNLVDNALDFSPDGAKVELALHHDARHAIITVRDHGPGIPDYARERIFSRFYSLARPHSQKKSTGLGLPFVREVAALHHGQATLESAPGGGAQASLTLPLIRG